MAPDRARRTLLLLSALALPSGAAALAIRPTGSTVRSSISRAGAITALEAFDLLPVIDCLKLDNMDAVQLCMDKLEPWVELSGDGVSFSLNAVNGFIGGSVGAMGTILATRVKKDQVKERLACTYCDATGQILCGHCLGSGIVSFKDDTGATVSEPCSNCEGTGTVVCINCQGSGISVPEDFLIVLGDEEVGFTEEDYIGLFDETPIPGRTMPPIKPKPKEPAAVGAARAVEESNGSSDGPKPVDYIDGLG